jgi:hypothetical protein
MGEGSDTLIKPAYITATGVSPNAIYNAKVSGSRAKASLSKNKHKRHYRHHDIEE